ncbi:hypothetical protein ONZ45_g18267 [Pleurotus djamor]|nr:hypothetical protein ONZ45_g18267 [Pleurotus djamor]
MPPKFSDALATECWLQLTEALKAIDFGVGNPAAALHIQNVMKILSNFFTRFLHTTFLKLNMAHLNRLGLESTYGLRMNEASLHPSINAAVGPLILRLEEINGTWVQHNEASARLSVNAFLQEAAKAIASITGLSMLIHVEEPIPEIYLPQKLMRVTGVADYVCYLTESPEARGAILRKPFLLSTALVRNTILAFTVECKAKEITNPTTLLSHVKQLVSELLAMAQALG